jgi:site-specific recombinase XerD
MEVEAVAGAQSLPARARDWVMTREQYDRALYADPCLPELPRGARCHTSDKPWHALRHTFAAHAVMSGIPLYTVKELLGHAGDPRQAGQGQSLRT